MFVQVAFEEEQKAKAAERERRKHAFAIELRKHIEEHGMLKEDEELFEAVQTDKCVDSDLCILHFN